MRRASSAGGWAAPLLLMGGCAEPVDAPSAFSQEQYLCDSALEFDERVEACREAYLLDGSCKGTLSFRGDIESQAVVVDAPVFVATYTDTPGPRGSMSRNYGLKANAPYFRFSLNLGQFPVEGFPLAPLPTIVPGVPVSNRQDIVNLEVRSANYLSSMFNVNRDVALQTTDEVRVTASADLSRGGFIDFCFHLFPTPLIP